MYVSPSDLTYLWCLRVASNLSFATLIAREVQTYSLGRVLALVTVAVCGRDGLLAGRIIGHVHVGSGSFSGSDSKMGRVPSDARRWCHVSLGPGLMSTDALGSLSAFGRPAPTRGLGSISIARAGPSSVRGCSPRFRNLGRWSRRLGIKQGARVGRSELAPRKQASTMSGYP